LVFFIFVFRLQVDSNAGSGGSTATGSTTTTTAITTTVVVVVVVRFLFNESLSGVVVKLGAASNDGAAEPGLGSSFHRTCGVSGHGTWTKKNREGEEADVMHTPFQVYLLIVLQLLSLSLSCNKFHSSLPLPLNPPPHVTPPFTHRLLSFATPR
jgi:hypothetical protein